MKLRIEIDPDAEEEITIKAKRTSEELRYLEESISSLLSRKNEISVRSGEKEWFIQSGEILFIEVFDAKTYVHTKSDAYLSPLRLYELEELLPKCFVRASKSSSVNADLIRSLSRSPTGVGEAGFSGTNKKVFISRMYYKLVRDRIEEMRLSK